MRKSTSDASHEWHGASSRSVFFRLRRALDVLERRAASLGTIGALVLIGVGGYLQVGPNWMWGIGLFAVVLYEFQKRLDQGLPLMQVAALVAALQWVIGPVLTYYTDYVEEGRYNMYVPEEIYFGYALPGTAAFAIGLLAIGSSVRQRELLARVRRGNFILIGLILNGLALLGDVAAYFLPVELAFAFHLMSQLRYVGALYFLFSRSPWRWPLFGLAIFPLLGWAVASAMFHDLLLWMGMLSCFWFAMRKKSPWSRFAFLTISGLIMFTIQAIKQDYRAKRWQGEEASLLEEVVARWSQPSSLTADEALMNVIARLNQGWIVSAILKNVPAESPYVHGETVRDAVLSSIIPRFLWSDKVKAGGQKNFRRFTGLQLSKSTSMAISPLGEAYVNFGRLGGIAFMVVMGLCFAAVYGLCLKYVRKHPAFLFWIPLIFYQAIKAETELAVVLNQVTKGALVAFSVYWVVCLHLIPESFRPLQVGRRVLLPGRAKVGIGARPAIEAPASLPVQGKD